ncbi:MAG: PIN domain-containing protein [Chloroflexi bacterium]|nr:PIN domain-containing protein [Chloroflexota bacterium]
MVESTGEALSPMPEKDLGEEIFVRAFEAAPVFLDSNVFLRHLTQDVQDQAERASAEFDRIARGELTVVITDLVVAEIVFTLERLYRLPKADIQQHVSYLLALPGIQLAAKARFSDIFALYVDQNVSFGDAYSVVTLRRDGRLTAITFDRHFDRIPGVDRREPERRRE